MSSHCYNKNLPLAGRDASLLLENGITVDVSTHTPLAGRDGCGSCSCYRRMSFYSHAPCGT